MKSPFSKSPKTTRKSPRKLESETKTKTPPSLIKEQFQTLQLALLARSLQKAAFPLTLPKTKDDLIALQVQLMEQNFNRTITSTDFSLGNQAVRNLISLIAPAPGMNVAVTQTVDLSALQKKVDEMKPDDESVVIEAINRLGAAPSSEKA